MKTYLNLFFIVLFSITTSTAQISIDAYKTEISQLSTEQEIDGYWKNLLHLDQNVFLKIENTKKYDSMSVCNMIRTALMYKIHGDKAHRANNVTPIINLSHNINGGSSLAFWPVIDKCSKLGGIIKSFGGNYPAYELESVSGAYYEYSLLGQEAKYPNLIDKLNKQKKGAVIENLLKAFEYQKELQNLTTNEILNRWTIQPFTDKKEDGFFEFVKMSDNAVYLRKHDRLQKLIHIKSKDNSNLYRIENEPFGWYYEYENDGNLSLYNDKDQVLIEYTKHQ